MDNEHLAMLSCCVQKTTARFDRALKLGHVISK
jgi:hypothetical protein